MSDPSHIIYTGGLLMSTVVGVFHSRDDAERAAQELRQQGLHERISIVARGDEGGRGAGAARGGEEGRAGGARMGAGEEGRTGGARMGGGEEGRAGGGRMGAGEEGRAGGGRMGFGGEERGGRMGAGEVTSGTWTGAAIGGAGGLLAAAGLFTVPGIGPLLAMGPLAAGLTGAAAGGLVGGLVDLGIPRHRSEYYESRVREGKILCAVEADGNEEDVRQVFERYGAADIETH